MSPTEITLGPVDVERDLDTIAQLVHDSDVAGTGRSDSTRDRVQHHLEFPLALRDEHRLAYLGTQPVGAMIAECDPESREVFVDLVAVGDHREHVFSVLLGSARDLAHRCAMQDPRPVPDGADAYALSAEFWQLPILQRAGDDASAHVFEEAGLRMIRTFWTMVWDISAGVRAPVAPAGVTRRRVESEDDLRIVHRVDQQAFSGHFGFLHEDPFDRWLEMASARPHFSVERWWIAELDGEPVGMCLLDDSRREFGQEYVGVLGVLESARGRGIGRWLLECSGADAAGRGVKQVALNCDSENTTNATALYEAVGFVVSTQVNLWNEPVVVRS